MSVTIATLIFFSAGVLLALSLLELPLSSEPQATSAPVPSASSATSNRRIKECLTNEPSSGIGTKFAGA